MSVAYFSVAPSGLWANYLYNTYSFDYTNYTDAFFPL